MHKRYKGSNYSIKPKVASMPYVFQLETRTVSHRRFSNFFSNLKIGLEVPKAFGKLRKNFVGKGGNKKIFISTCSKFDEFVL